MRSRAFVSTSRRLCVCKFSTVSTLAKGSSRARCDALETLLEVIRYISVAPRSRGTRASTTGCVQHLIPFQICSQTPPRDVVVEVLLAVLARIFFAQVLVVLLVVDVLFAFSFVVTNVGGNPSTDLWPGSVPTYLQPRAATRRPTCGPALSPAYSIRTPGRQPVDRLVARLCPLYISFSKNASPALHSSPQLSSASFLFPESGYRRLTCLRTGLSQADLLAPLPFVVSEPRCGPGLL